MEFRLAYITAKDRDEAKALGRELVEKKLAACVNIVDGMESLYWWEGKLDESREAILIAKTEAGRMERLISEVKARHSYACPCVLVLPVLGGNAAYLEWLERSLK